MIITTISQQLASAQQKVFNKCNMIIDTLERFKFLDCNFVHYCSRDQVKLLLKIRSELDSSAQDTFPQVN